MAFGAPQHDKVESDEFIVHSYLNEGENIK